MSYNLQLPKKVELILNQLNNAGYEAYVVGGCVRDSLLNRKPHDWDICTSATPEQTIKVFENYHIIPTGIKHGTVTIMIEREGFEVTTYRIDGKYSDNRRPDNVSFSTNLEDDLKRRDFTINAMAYNPSEGIIDYYNGIDDLKNQLIRCVGNPKERFSEDILRVLRLWRFCIQLGFYPDNTTMNAAKEIIMMGLLKTVSYERIQSEFVKAIQGNKIEFTTQPDFFLEGIIPEWKDMNFSQNNPYHIFNVKNHSLCAYDCLDDSADIITRIATLLHDIGKPHCFQDDENGIRHFKGHGKVSADMTDIIMKRLKFDNNTREKVVELIHYHDATFEESKKSVKRWLNKIGEKQYRRLLLLRIADIKGQAPEYQKDRVEKIYRIKSILEDVLKENACFKISDLAINGNDLIACGIPEGKEIGSLLNTLLNAVIDGDVKNEREDLFVALDMMIGNVNLYATSSK